MNQLNTDTAFHGKLIHAANESSGFSVSELTGYSPEQVRRAAEALVKAEKLVRIKIGGHRVRYFVNQQLADRYSSGQTTAQASRGMSNKRVTARWDRDAPMRITSATKIYVAPPLPRNVIWTNTYPKF